MDENLPACQSLCLCVPFFYAKVTDKQTHILSALLLVEKNALIINLKIPDLLFQFMNSPEGFCHLLRLWFLK